MPKSQHSEAAIIAALQQLDAGRKAADVAREVGVSTYTIYAWKAKYGGMDVSEAQEVKQLRDENTRLKKLVADLSLDKDALQSVIPKKRMELPAMKAGVEHLKQDFAFSERRACGLLQVPVSTFRYRPSRRDQPLRDKLVELAREKPRFGYRRLNILLQRDGIQVNHKRVWRVYREAGLSVKRKRRKRLARVGTATTAATRANERWSLDFVSDGVASGRAIRLLCIVDTYTRECLALDVDTSFPSPRVTRVLDGLIASRGVPERIRCDNGPELTSRHFLAWCIERKISLEHIQPGRPMQNGHVESFNGKLRDECLNVSWFRNLFDARRQTHRWRKEYNEFRPHSSLGYRTPVEFAQLAKAPSCAGQYVADVGQGASNASPLPHTPIPAQNTKRNVNVSFV
ncbi:MAG TPA: IS3 family transposase [Bryobacteraceae bacterium]|nr:IS3 family transposase [Bryobacteraceae bacterium]